MGSGVVVASPSTIACPMVVSCNMRGMGGGEVVEQR